MKKLLNLKPAKGILYFVRHNQIITLPFNEQDLNKWEDELEQFLMEMTVKQVEEDFKRHTDHCNRCIYQQVCRL